MKTDNETGIDLHHEYYQSVSDTYFTREDFVRYVLDVGANLEVPELPGTHLFMPGQQMNSFTGSIRSGPAHRPYMIVGLYPDGADVRSGQHLTSNAGKVLRSCLGRAGIPLDEVYYTTANRFSKPFNVATCRTGWLKTGWEYLMKEFAIVQPKAILFLGAEVTKLAYGNKTRMNTVRGQPRIFGIEDGHECPSLASDSHLKFVSNTAGEGVLIEQLKVFRDLAYSATLGALDGINYPDRDYDYLWDLDVIRREVTSEIEAGNKIFAIDVETGTDTGHPEDEYVITFQWSSRPGHARVIPLYVERPEPIDWIDGHGRLLSDYGPDEELPPMEERIQLPRFDGSGVDRKKRGEHVPHYLGALEEIKRLLYWAPDTKLMGHNLRYDLKSMRDDWGFEIRQFCTAARSFDTMHACHLLGKESSFGLKDQTLKHTDMGAYESPMKAWVDKNSGSKKLFPGKEEDQFFFGYRDICYKYLLPYAACDVDATWRLYLVFDAQLREPGNEKLLELFERIQMPLQHVLIDVETHGMPASLPDLQELSQIYRDKYQSLIEELQDITNWPKLNVNSPDQVAALVYSPPYKNCDKETLLKQIPPDAKRLGLTPILTTGKYPQKWSDIQAQGLERYNGVSCSHDTIVSLKAANSERIGEYGNRVLELILHIKELKQFVTMFLAEPSYATPAETGRPIYGKGLMSCINSKGRICTQISVLSETGRWKHSRPNLANLPKNKEANIEKIMGHKVPMLRHCFVAPEGYEIMEADYSSAELYVLGYMSGDPAFIEVLESGQDVHGYNAVKVFNLDCAPDEVKKKYKAKRAAVKTVVFGLVYGLSPSGLAEKLTVELGRIVPLSEAQDIIDQFFTTYPKIKAFIDQSKRDCLEKGYVETAYGRRRYFPGVTKMSKDKQAAAQREATNARVQGTVADALNLALINLDTMRYDTEIGKVVQWEFVVAIHDAILVVIPKQYREVMAGILKYVMSDTCPLPGTNGRRLGIDAESGPKWQEFTDVEPMLLSA